MASLKGIGKVFGLTGLVFGAYILLNADAAYSKNITDVTKGIKQCYEGKVKGWTENTRKRNRERCAFAVVADYADKDLGNNDGVAEPNEIRNVVDRINKVLAEDLKEEMSNNSLVNEELSKTDSLRVDKEPDVKVNAQLEKIIGELKIVEGDYKVFYGAFGLSGDSPYSEVILTGEKKFSFHDEGDDDKLDGVKDCVDDSIKNFCGDDIHKKSKALVGGRETTSGEYLIELKRHMANAYSQYLMKNFNKSKAIIDTEKRHIRYKDNNFAFFIADSDKDGITDTLVVKKKDFEGDFIMKMYGNRSKAVMDIIGGLYYSLSSQ